MGICPCLGMQVATCKYRAKRVPCKIFGGIRAAYCKTHATATKGQKIGAAFQPPRNINLTYRRSSNHQTLAFSEPDFMCWRFVSVKVGQDALGLVYIARPTGIRTRAVRRWETFLRAPHLLTATLYLLLANDAPTREHEADAVNRHDLGTHIHARPSKRRNLLREHGSPRLRKATIEPKLFLPHHLSQRFPTHRHARLALQELQNRILRPRRIDPSSILAHMFFCIPFRPNLF